MPSPDKLEVFHKILHEAAHADVPVHETQSYSQIADEDKKAFAEIQNIWELSKNYNGPEQTFDKDKAFQSFLQKIKTESTAETSIIHTINPQTTSVESNIPDSNIRHIGFKYQSLLKYAAVAVCLITATYFFMQRPSTVSTDNSGLFVTLDDQSKVWLDKNTSLVIHKFSGNKRKVEVTGKAYFEVTKNENAPFEIHTQSFDITVLGTTFVVDQTSSEVDVLSGKVEVAVSDNKITLQKNEKIAIINEKIKKSASSGNLPSWANPELSFDNTPLNKVAEDLSAFFQVTITLDQEMNWTMCPFNSGSLAATSLEDIFTLLSLSYDCKVTEVDKNTYLISKVNCK